jgi:mannose-6-phosphate isomerase-like protein (cupin superfamily)
MITISDEIDKAAFFNAIAESISHLGLHIEKSDMTRPWGGFFVISEEQAHEFSMRYFNIPAKKFTRAGKLSPKVLIVAPHHRLSWQYHDRRAEVWKILKGRVGVIVSPDNDERECRIFKPDDMITLHQHERHRLVGLHDWAVIAEIWQHTDPDHPSDENDIVRLQDDYGR